MNENVLNRSAPFYNDALKSSGYKNDLKKKKKTNNVKRARSRNIIWFNPPYSINVKTNVAKTFLSIADKHFPKKHRLHKLFNRNNLKVSYSCVPNISTIISSHNKKVLTNDSTTYNKPCNCRNKDSCPLNGNCQDKHVIYKCNVKTSEDEEGVHYIGLTENTFKERWYQHKNSFKYENKAKSTELSKHIWNLKNDNITPTLSWEVIDHARPYVNGGNTCNLCLTEKFHIITSNLKLLNKRSELISTCRHVNKHLLKNYKSIPPDT